MTQPLDPPQARLMRALTDHGFTSPYGYANAHDYLNGPNDPPAGPERDAALAALRAADEAAEQQDLDAFLAALEQAGVQVTDR
jgi:hypothetical protein